MQPTLKKTTYTNTSTNRSTHTEVCSQTCLVIKIQRDWDICVEKREKNKADECSHSNHSETELPCNSQMVIFERSPISTAIGHDGYERAIDSSPAEDSNGSSKVNTKPKNSLPIDLIDYVTYNGQEKGFQ